MPASITWTGRLGVVLAVAGSAVGLGNFLKFPGLLATYGGGILIPYLAALIVIGLPLCWAEWAMGKAGARRGVHSAPAILLAVTGRRWGAALGGAMPAIVLGIYGYYLVVEAWCLFYAWQYLVSGIPTGGGSALFARMTGVGGDGQVAALPGVLACVAICHGLNLLVLAGGIRAGIERLCTWGLPLLVLCAVIVVARVLTLGEVTGADGVARTVSDGLGAVWNPERTVTASDGTARTVSLATTLAKPEAWLAAASQILFTLSVGMGVLLTYASYLRERDEVALASTTAAAANQTCEVVLGGMMAVPAAVLFLGSGILIAVPGLFGLGFVSLPEVFAAMPGGQAIGFCFFALLFLAAITSSLSMLQPGCAMAQEVLGLGRGAAVAALGLITLPGIAITLWLSGGLTALDTMDFWIGNLALMLCALATAVIVGWVWPGDGGMAELRRGARLDVAGLAGPVLRWVTPLALLAILAGFLAKELAGGGRVAALADWRVALSAGWVIALVLVGAALGHRARYRLAARIGAAP